MQIGTPYPLFPTFGIFCEQARTFPHVLPHKLTSALEGYYQIFGDQLFILTTRYRRPEIRFFEQAYAIGESIKKSFYWWFEKPVPIYRPEYHALCPLVFEGATCAYIDNYRMRISHEDIQMLFSYAEVAADKLYALKTEPAVSTPGRKSLSDLPPFTELSRKAGDYIANSTYLQVSPVSDIVNQIKTGAVITPDVLFSRLENLDETVQYGVSGESETLEV